MEVTVIWESRFPGASVKRGEEVTQKIWNAMRHFAGYVGHEIIRDLDDPGHILVISRWASRDAADKIKEQYASHPNAILANELVAEARRRCVGVLSESFPHLATAVRCQKLEET